MSFHTFDLIAHNSDPSFIQKGEESNHVKIIVVLSEQEDKDLIEGLLKNILNAVNIDITSEVHILEIASIAINILDTIKDLGIEKILCFGTTPKALSLNLNAQLYHPVHISAKTFLFAESLAFIEANKGRKKLLWDNLQSIFLAK